MWLRNLCAQQFNLKSMWNWPPFGLKVPRFCLNPIGIQEVGNAAPGQAGRASCGQCALSTQLTRPEMSSFLSSLLIWSLPEKKVLISTYFFQDYPCFRIISSVQRQSTEPPPPPAFLAQYEFKCTLCLEFPTEGLWAWCGGSCVSSLRVGGESCVSSLSMWVLGLIPLSWPEGKVCMESAGT